MKSHSIFPSVTNITLVLLVVINGLLTFVFGLLLWVGYGIGDPAGLDPTKIKTENMQFAVNIMIFSTVFIIIGSVMALLWKRNREWTKYGLITLGALHLVAILFILINRE